MAKFEQVPRRAENIYTVKQFLFLQKLKQTGITIDQVNDFFDEAERLGSLKEATDGFQQINI